MQRNGSAAGPGWVSSPLDDVQISPAGLVSFTYPVGAPALEVKSEKLKVNSDKGRMRGKRTRKEEKGTDTNFLTFRIRAPSGCPGKGSSIKLLKLLFQRGRDFIGLRCQPLSY